MTKEEVKPITAWKPEDDDSAAPPRNRADSLVRAASQSLNKTSTFDTSSIKEWAHRLITGIWLLVCTMPLWVDDWPDSFAEDLQGGAAWVSLIFVFTIGPHLAQTLNQVFQVLLGIVLAWCNIWLVDAILGNEAVSSAGDEAIVWIDYILVLALLLYLKIGGRMQLIAIHFTSSYAMLLLNKTSDLDYMERGRMSIYQSLVGASFAIVAVVVTYPGPRLLTWEASALMLKISSEIAAQSSAAHSFYSAAQAGPLLEKLHGDIEDMMAHIVALNGKLKMVWWEGFDIGRLGEKRDMMLRVNSLYGKLADIVLIINTNISRGFKESHADTMKVIGEDCFRLLQASESLLTCLTRVALDGRITPAEQKEIEQEQSNVVNSIDALGLKVKQLHKKGDYDPQQHSERFYVWANVWYAQAIVDGANDIMNRPPVSRVPIGSACKKVIASSKPTWEHFEFVVWNLAKILLGFGIGKHEDFNSGIAVNLGWLLEKHMGSSTKKDMQRLLGVTLPYVFGGVIFIHYSNCKDWDFMVRTFWYYVIEVLCLHTIFTSKEWGYVALLSGVFFGIPVLGGCNDDLKEGATEAAMYNKIQDVTIAVVIIMMLNLAGVVLESWIGEVPGAPGTASGILKRMIERWLNNSCEGLVACFNGEEKCVPHLEYLQGRINAMTALNGEAKVEPRLWKKAWPGPLADQIIISLKGLRLCHVALARLGPIDLKTKAGTKFDDVDKDLRETVRAAKALVDMVLIRQERAEVYNVEKVALSKHQVIEKSSQRAELEVLPMIISMIATATDSESAVKQSVEADPIVRLSVFLCAFERAMGHVGHISKSIFKQL